MLIDTPRLRLRAWEERDRPAFAAMNADPEVMADLGGPLGRTDSDAKFERYVTAFAAVGLTRWCVERRDGTFIGYCGVLPSKPGHPLGDHAEIGWRLVRAAWGQADASEAARAALADAFLRTHLPEILAYTAPDNRRSQAVMARLQLSRDEARDFTATYDGVTRWHGLVWVARRPV